MKVLENLKGTRAGDPIKILDVLSNSRHEIGVIQSLLGSHLQAQQKKIAEDYHEIRDNMQEIDKLKDRINKLQTEYGLYLFFVK